MGPLENRISSLIGIFVIGWIPNLISSFFKIKFITKDFRNKNIFWGTFPGSMASYDFDTLFTKTKPHIIEMICISLDYMSFKNCLEVTKAWKDVLTSKIFQKKAKYVFQEEILEDERKLLRISNEGNVEEVRKLLSICMINVDCSDINGWSPLYEAAVCGHKDVVQLLLDRGADPNKAQEDGWTPLHRTAVGCYKDVAELLLDRGGS